MGSSACSEDVRMKLRIKNRGRIGFGFRSLNGERSEPRSFNWQSKLAKPSPRLQITSTASRNYVFEATGLVQ